MSGAKRGGIIPNGLFLPVLRIPFRRTEFTPGEVKVLAVTMIKTGFLEVPLW